MGVSWATTISVLWMVVSLTCKQRGLTNPGLYNGLFNLSMCCPQIVISLWAHKDLGTFDGTFPKATIAPHETMMLRLKAA